MINGYLILELHKLHESEDYIQLDETLAIELYNKLIDNNKPIIVSMDFDDSPNREIQVVSYNEDKSSSMITLHSEVTDWSTGLELQVWRSDVEGSEGEYHHYAQYRITIR